jgi:hypothetical protein
MSICSGWLRGTLRRPDRKTQTAFSDLTDSRPVNSSQPFSITTKIRHDGNRFSMRLSGEWKKISKDRQIHQKQDQRQHPARTSTVNTARQRGRRGTRGRSWDQRRSVVLPLSPPFRSSLKQPARFQWPVPFSSSGNGELPALSFGEQSARDRSRG